VATKSYDNKFDELRYEAGLAWDWLRKRPEYKTDYDKWSKLKNPIPVTLQEELKDKYGFYPLINPKIDAIYFRSKVVSPSRIKLHHPPWEFLEDFCCFFTKRKNLDSGVDFKNLNYIDIDIYRNPKRYKKYGCKPTPLPDRLLVSIDPKKPVDYILELIRNYLRAVKKIYKVKDRKPRITDYNLIYRNYVLEKLGVTTKETRKTVAPYSDNEAVNESVRKKAYRIEKKLNNLGHKSK
jgi:hypothetical protein